MEKQYKVSAALGVKDNGYFAAMQKAQKAAQGLGTNLDTAGKKSTSFKDTMLGMASAIGVTALISSGFNMISDSVGKAMARMDTMDNFNRTMTLMTGSTDKASGALESLKDKVSGTAYGLDVAAKATQGLVTSGTEIKTATKWIGGWMDAVSTYGDGTNETLGNVTFQLSQMASKGKANLGDLKSAMEAGIPVIKIYAEATGQSTETVSEQISKGAISAEKFLGVMDEAFRSGTKSFTKIEGAAKNAGGTWKGTFDNMQAATTRGMLSIIKAIEDSRADANLPGMKDAVAEFGRTTEKVLNGVAGVAGFVAQHFETLSTVLVTGLSAWAGYRVVDEIADKFTAFKTATSNAGSSLEVFFNGQSKGTSIQKAYYNAMKDGETAERMRAAAQRLNIELTTINSDGITKYTRLTDAQKAAILAETGAISIKSLVMGVLSGKIALTTAAQIAWNMAMKANPIGMIVAGVAALIGALKWLNGKLTETSKEHKAANKEAEAMASTNESLVKSTKELGKSYQDNATDAKANAAEARRMVDNLKKIEKSTMSAEEKQMRMSDAVKELNTQYPNLNVQLDKTGKAIKGTTDEIYDQIDAMEQQAKMEAMKEYLKELYKDQIEYEMSIDSTTKTMQEMEKQGTSTQKTWFGLGSATTEEFKKLKDSSVELNGGLTDTNNKIADLEGQLNIANDAQLRLRMEQDEQKKSLQSLNEEYGVTTFAILDYSQKSGTELDKVGEKVLSLAEKYALSSDQIMAKVAESGLSLEEWAKQHEKLTEISEKYGLATETVQTAVREQGISLDEFAKKHDENLKTAGDAIDTYVGNATDGWSKLKQNTTISWKEYMDNMESNRKAQENWWKNLKILNDAGIDDSIIAELEQMGPAGANQLQRFVDELYKGSDKQGTAYDDMKKKTKNRVDAINEERRKAIVSGGNIADEAITEADWTEKGERPLIEMRTGMANEMSGLNTQAENVGKGLKSNIVKGMNKEQLKRDAIANGKFAMDGLDIGLNEKKGTIYSTAEAIARKISQKFRAAMEINSPSRLFRRFGNFIDEGLVIGMKDGIPDVARMSQKMADTVADVDLKAYQAKAYQEKVHDANIAEQAKRYQARANPAKLEKTQLAQPLELILHLGPRAFRAFVDDISKLQDHEVNLELQYP